MPDELREQPFSKGDLTTLYLSDQPVKESPETVLVKVANDPNDNDLLIREDRALRNLSSVLPPPWSDCVPEIHNSSLGTNGCRQNVLQFFPGFFSAEDIHAQVPQIDQRTMIWMWKRLLGLISWIHQAGWVHGAILPPHVLFYPDNTRREAVDKRIHSLRLVDWCFAVDSGTQPQAWIPAWKEFYPPEVTRDRKVYPETDVYMAAKLMIYLCGGDIVLNHIPGLLYETHAILITCLKQCLPEDRRRRPNAIDHLRTFSALAEEVYGKPRFHEFRLPGI